MKRFSSLFCGLAMVAAGCGGTGGTTPAGTADLSMPAAKPDLWMPPPPDMAGGPCINGMPGCSGDPCSKPTDCAKGLGPNQTANCIKSQMLQGGDTLTWPGGFCTTPCRVAKNDPNNALNSDCPGGNATCWGSGAMGQCVPACASSMDCRTDYACFVVNNIAQAPLGCLPKALSECDPAKPGTCKRMCGDGGMVLDGGALDCYEDTCVNTGDGTVGTCVPGCDFFKNLGCPGGQDTDCHASDVTGEGLCVGACTTADCQNGTFNGGACGNFYSDCAGGYGCLSGKCRKYCNDANKGTQCAQGATCNKLSNNTKVPTSVAGLCSK